MPPRAPAPSIGGFARPSLEAFDSHHDETDAIRAEIVYQVEDEIARGGMGAIMRAIDQDIRREVAVKFLLNQADDRQKARFVEEAQITGQLEHPNIVPIHQLGVHAEGRCFFSMKMVKGRSLAEILKAEDNAYSLSKLLAVFVSICNAMAFAHSRKVIHRDLKPANVMVGDFGEVYVMDWGLAKSLSEVERQAREAPTPSAQSEAMEGEKLGSSPTLELGQKSRVTTSRATLGDLTQAGAIMGTPAYMPPEQATGDAVDERADIYSLGAILYEIMTLTPPVGRGGDMIAMLMRVVEGKIDLPEARAPERVKSGWITPELSAIAMKTLAIRRENRYQTVETLRRDIELFLEGRSVSAKQDSAWEMAKKLVKRNKATSIVTFVAVMLLTAVLIASAWTNYLARKETDRAYLALAKQTNEAVPAMVRSAKLAIKDQQFDDAFKQAELALAYAPKDADASMVKAQVLIVRQNFADAAAELAHYLTLRPDDQEARELAPLCLKAKPEDVPGLLEFARVFHGRQAYSLVDGLLSKYGKSSQEARNQILHMYREIIERSWPGKGKQLTIDPSGLHLSLNGSELTDLSPLKGIPLRSLDLDYCRKLEDLSPLKGMPLTRLNLIASKVHDLTPLKGMKLTSLSAGATSGLKDLSPLRGMPLAVLDIGSTSVNDLSPLQGMPLVSLYIYAPAIKDLTPLRGQKLTEVGFNPKGIAKGLDVLREMESLKLIGDNSLRSTWLPPAEFWKRLDAVGTK